MTLRPGTLPDDPDKFTVELKVILQLTRAIENSTSAILDKIDELIEAVKEITD